MCVRMARRAASLSCASIASNMRDVLGLHGQQVLHRPLQRQAARQVDRELERRAHRFHHRLEELVAGGARDGEMELEVGVHADDPLLDRHLHPIERVAHGEQHFGRAVLRRVVGRVAFEARPELVALAHLRQAVDRPEADRRGVSAGRSARF